MHTLQVAGFLNHSHVNGIGFRTTIFLSGCSHHCPFCHNEEAQNPLYGDLVTVDALILAVKKNMPLIDGVTLSGGDPLFQFEGTYNLLLALKALSLSVWVYTGYTYEFICTKPHLARLLPLIDVLVDGPYVHTCHTTTYRYIGSSNQRILKLKEGRIIEECFYTY